MKIFYEHIAKTGGTYIISVLEPFFKNSYRIFDVVDLSSYDFLSTHLRYKDICIDDDYIKLTSIRHPMERFISLYNFLLLNSDKEWCNFSPSSLDLNTFFKRNDTKSYLYFANNVKDAIDVVSSFDYIIDHSVLKEDLEHFAYISNIDIYPPNNKINVGKYIINSFSVSDIIKITKELSDDIIFYDKITKIKKDINRKYEQKN